MDYNKYSWFKLILKFKAIMYSATFYFGCHFILWRNSLASSLNMGPFIFFFFLVLFLHNRVWSLQARRSTAGVWSRVTFLHRRTEGTKPWMKISFPSTLVQGHGSYWFVCLNASTRNSPYIFNTEDLAPRLWVLTWLFAPRKMGQALLGLWCDSNGWAALCPDHQAWLTYARMRGNKWLA